MLCFALTLNETCMSNFPAVNTKMHWPHSALQVFYLHLYAPSDKPHCKKLTECLFKDYSNTVTELQSRDNGGRLIIIKVFRWKANMNLMVGHQPAVL